MATGRNGKRVLGWKRGEEKKPKLNTRFKKKVEAKERREVFQESNEHDGKKSGTWDRQKTRKLRSPSALASGRREILFFFSCLTNSRGVKLQERRQQENRKKKKRTVNAMD